MDGRWNAEWGKKTGRLEIGRLGERGGLGEKKMNVQHRTSNRKNKKHRRGGGVEVGIGNAASGLSEL
jgi:hypothetical protein